MKARLSVVVILFLLFLLLLFQIGLAHGAVTKVGNGDDGSDLEEVAPIQEGRILEARQKAVVVLKSLNTPGIGGLGNLLPEVENTSLFLAKKDVNAALTEDQGSFHSDMRGFVYARTFAQSHAPTRFFPIAEKLEIEQLVALHIHEALHRALPASVKEKESVVSAITLAISSQGATHDRIQEVANREIPEFDRRLASGPALSAPGEALGAGSSLTSSTLIERYPIPEDARIKQPSSFGYGYRQYHSSKEISAFPVMDMHVIQSFLYPFGNDRTPLGLGIEASFIGRPHGGEAGPLSLSARMRLWSGRGFDIGSWGVVSLNTLSADELKHSPIGRDVTTLGLSMRKELSLLYVENLLSLTLDSDSRQKIGSIEYTYSFGKVVMAAVHTGVSVWRLKLGGYAEVYLADYFRVSGGAFPWDSGRYRIISGGPELAWISSGFSVALTGRFLLNATQDANFDYLGNIMGPGVSQGSLGGSVSFYF